MARNDVKSILLFLMGYQFVFSKSFLWSQLEQAPCLFSFLDIFSPHFLHLKDIKDNGIKAKSEKSAPIIDHTSKLSPLRFARKPTKVAQKIRLVKKPKDKEKFLAPKKTSKIKILKNVSNTRIVIKPPPKQYAIIFILWQQFYVRN